MCMCIIRNVMCTDPLASKYGRLIFSTLVRMPVTIYIVLYNHEI